MTEMFRTRWPYLQALTNPNWDAVELSTSAAELARQLGVPTNRITEILNRRRAIPGDTAPRLAHYLWHQCGILAEPAKSL